MANNCIVLMGHKCTETLYRAWDKLQSDMEGKADIYLLFDTTHHSFDNTYFKTENVMLFNRDSLAKRYDMYRCSEEGGLIPGNCILPILEFTRLHDYAYVWRVEYDVFFNGNWNNFFRHFLSNTSDLLATTLYSESFRKDWPWWKSFKKPLFSFRGIEKIRAFLPICRLSKMASDTLIRAYHKGWGGHEEVAVPTILYAFGLTLEDIGGKGEFVSPENMHRFYRNTPKNKGLSPGTLVCPPASCDAVTLPDMLYHALK